MWILSKFMMKRDRIQIPVWLIMLTFLLVGTIPAFVEMFATQADLDAMIMTLEGPAMVAMLGPLFGATFGAVYAQTMLIMTGVFGMGVMNVFLLSRHTRNDEEEGRMEVLRSLPIGRLDHLKAALVNAVIINVFFALIFGIALGLFMQETGYIGEGLTDFGAGMLFGALLGAIGLAFAGLTAFFVQLSANNRSILALSLGTLGLFYVLAAMGFVTEGAAFLSYLSPAGIMAHAQVYVRNYWWPVFVLLAWFIVFGAMALRLNAKRDLGAGLLPERAGKASAGCWAKSNFGFALKLSKNTLIGWASVVFLFAAIYGSIFGDIDTFLEGNDMFDALFYGIAPEDIAMTFMSFLLIIMSIFAAIPVVQIALKLKVEERKNRTEHVLARVVSRKRLITAYVIIATAAAPVMLFLAAFGLYISTSAVMDYPPALDTLFNATMAFLPAVWLHMAVAIALLGLLPNFSLGGWLFLVLSFLIVYIGNIIGLDESVQNISPFGHVYTYIIDGINWSASIIKIGLAAVLTFLGIYGYQRRDIEG